MERSLTSHSFCKCQDRNEILANLNILCKSSKHDHVLPGLFIPHHGNQTDED